MLHNLEIDSDNLAPQDPSPYQLANLINKTFQEPMQSFNPLPPTYLQQTNEKTLPEFCITEHHLFKSLLLSNPRKATGPDGIPGWVLKENADIQAQPISNILNQSYREARLPQSWKRGNITPIPKEKLMRNINKHLRPISLTPIISKIAESFVVETFVKPAVLKKDRNQYGTIPNSSTVYALISMIHEWNGSTDGNSGTTRVILFDFRKALDLIDHHILVQKLKTYDLPSWTIDWTSDFITCRKRVKLNQDCYLEWESVTAAVPQGTLLGPWLLIIMMNDIEIATFNNWKYVDDTTMSEFVNKGEKSHIQHEVDEAHKLQFNEGICKELHIGFSFNPTQFDPILINNNPVDVVDYAKILGLTVSNNLKWNKHVDEVIKKARMRLYFLSQLKK